MHLMIASILKVVVTSPIKNDHNLATHMSNFWIDNQWIQNISLSYESEQFFSDLFDCPDILLSWWFHRRIIHRVNISPFLLNIFSSCLVWRFDNVLDPEFEDDIHIFKEMFVEAIQAHNLRMTPTVHVLAHQVLNHVFRAGVPLGPTSEQAHRFEVICTK